MLKRIRPFAMVSPRMPALVLARFLVVAALCTATWREAGAATSPDDPTPGYVTPPAGGHSIDGTPCARWSIQRVGLQVIDSTLCPHNPPPPCGSPPGAVLGCKTTCASLRGNRITALANIDAGCDSGSHLGICSCGSDTGVVSIVADRRIKLKYTPVAEGSPTSVLAHIQASGIIDVTTILDRTSGSCDACASAGAFGKFTFDAGIATPDLSNALAANPPPSRSLSGDFCTGSSAVSIGASFGWPNNTVGGQWQYSQGGNRATKAGAEVWTFSKITCLPAPSTPTPVVYYMVMTGQAAARALTDSAGQAMGRAVIDFRRLAFEFPDGCEECAPPVGGHPLPGPAKG